MPHLGPFLLPGNRKQASPESGGKAVGCQLPKKKKGCLKKYAGYCVYH